MREVRLVDPIVYVSTWRIKEGKFPEYQRFYAKLLRAIRDRDPDVIAFYAFANAGRTEITNVHVFPDAPALERHMAVIGEQMALFPGELGPVMDLMDPLSVQVFGTPKGQAASMDQGMRDAGVPFTSKGRYLGGFSIAERLL
jgi:hypothetical protein